MRAISEQQARVYEYARDLGGKWFTIQELASGTNVPMGTATSLVAKFEERGLFDRMRIAPAHVFRLSRLANSADPQLVRRIEQAIPIFAERRQDWLEREEAVLSEVLPRVQPPGNLEVDDGDVESQRRGVPALSTPHPAAKPAKTPRPNARTRELNPARPRKADQVIELLRRPGGASIDELVAHFGTQPHSIRALISVSTRERGLKALYEDGRYRL